MVAAMTHNGSLWESAGQRASPALNGVFVAAVLGVDASSTCAVALGLARAQAQRRRVLLCDLFDEGSPISEIAGPGDLTGVSDVIEHGVSLGRAAHTADRVGNLSILPPGYDSPLAPAVVHHPRWGRLAGEFRDADALLLLALPANAAGTRPLLEITDGVVTVDAPALAAPLTRARVLAEVTRAVRRTPARPAPVAGVHAPIEPPSKRAREVPHRMTPAARSWTGAAFGLAAAATLIVIAYMALATGRQRQAAAGTGAVDTVAAGGMAAIASGVLNPADSGRAAQYSVEASAANTTFGALDALRTWNTTAATFVPEGDAGATWYRVRVGAFTSEGDAVQFSQAMRATLDSTTGIGGVIRTPFAFLIDSTQIASARDLVETYRQRGVPAYALLDGGSLVRLYVGAFESPQAAERMRGILMAANLNGALAFRVGRSY
ncbi:MAG: SPOR domain-containing protein [Gemmatimonadaceae bacterium]